MENPDALWGEHRVSSRNGENHSFGNKFRSGPMKKVSEFPTALLRLWFAMVTWLFQFDQEIFSSRHIEDHRHHDCAEPLDKRLIRTSDFISLLPVLRNSKVSGG
jgi:hypothetical protein